MSLPPEFSSERLVPGVPGEIAHGHVHRYVFAQAFAREGRVLDAACGEGCGSALLAVAERERRGCTPQLPRPQFRQWRQRHHAQ